MASTTPRVSQRPGRCWTAPMAGSKSKLHHKRGQSAAILRWGIAPLLPRFSMRIGCIQSVTDSRALGPTAPDYLLDRLSPVQLMRRDPTASYSPWALQIVTSNRFELTPLQLAGSCECSLPSDCNQCAPVSLRSIRRSATGYFHDLWVGMHQQSLTGKELSHSENRLTKLTDTLPR